MAQLKNKKIAPIWFVVAVIVPVALIFIFSSLKSTPISGRSGPNAVRKVVNQVFRIAPSAPRTLFVGDIMLDRSVAKHARKFGADSLFLKIAPLLAKADFVIGNLEGTMTSNPSISETDNSVLKFTFDPAYAALLRDLNFSALSLANNHALDFGEGGYFQTVANLMALGVETFGSPLNTTTDGKKLSARLGENRGKNPGAQFCLVGYHDLYIADPTPALNEIKKIRPDCGQVVLSAHWGIEYAAQATERQRELAHAFIDAGTDLVIGAHPHVVEPLEIYKNKAIFYSLGNFMFDQTFSYETEHGLAVEVEWTPTETTFRLVPVTIADREVGPADVADNARVLDSVLADSADLPGQENFVSDQIRSDIIKRQQFSLKSGPNNP